MRVHPLSRGVVVVLWAGLMAGCGDGTAPTPAPEVLRALPRALTSQEKAILAANTAFTLALFQKASAAQPAKNVFLSPLSASLALGMTMNGARNATLEGMRAALQFGATSQADINEGYKSLMSLLMGLDPTVESHVANAVWYRNTLSINPAFVAVGKDYFDADVAALDFTNVTASVKTVNDWVNLKTDARITKILETITDDDAMFLVNAIYFKGNWRTAFDRASTHAASFTAGDGRVLSVPMMHLEAASHVLRGARWPDGTKMVELPYGNAAFNMEVYLPPDTTTVDRWIGRLTLDDVRFSAESPLAEVSLWMPRVKLEYERTLNPDLTALGMGDAFSGFADFSGVTTNGTPLAISEVLQKTFLSIDEEGTEAAAVTKVRVLFVSAPGPLSMRVDRPYLVLIRERLSGTIVFIGKINTI